MQIVSKYELPERLELTTPVEVLTHEPDGTETVSVGFVSARYFERADLYDVTVPSEKCVMRGVEAGRIRVTGEARNDIVKLAAYQAPPVNA